MAEPTRITRPDGTVLELIETIPAEPADGHRPARAKARKRALDILFEADLRQLPATAVLAAAREENDPPVRDFTVELVEGVAARVDELDARISRVLAAGWTLDRMPRVDRNLARLAAFELATTDTPADVVLAEAVALSEQLSTDDSPAFLNGLLSALIAGGGAR
ncbi:MAG: transcription antitermination factor NusB [Propionicimonas sp.]|uniref:transcription antitermination factor NusB n=1 Tax=Propionicimonas sp. TaxID=1955623 RepID=UPI003D153148